MVRASPFRGSRARYSSISQIVRSVLVRLGVVVYDVIGAVVSMGRPNVRSPTWRRARRNRCRV